MPITLVAAVIAVAAWQPWATSAAAEEAVVIPAPAIDAQPGPRTSEVAVLAGGCFWGVQGVFQHVKGVTRAVSGYAGGDARPRTTRWSARRDRPRGSGPDHLRPDRDQLRPVLQIYFSVAHDPTKFNRQGPDIGPQYRSAIFPTRRAGALAKAYIAQLDRRGSFARDRDHDRAGQGFYPAEDYHQDYLR